MRRSDGPSPVRATVPAVRTALALADQHVGHDAVIGSALLLGALAHSHGTADWARVLLLSGFPSLEALAGVRDADHGSSALWEGRRVSSAVLSSVALAEMLCDRYGYETIRPDILALALAADPRAGASAFGTSGGLSHSDLMVVLQMELTGGEWDGLDDAVAEHLDAYRVDRCHCPFSVEEEARIARARQVCARLTTSAERALLRAEAARSAGDAETADRFESAALKYAEMLVVAERRLAGLGAARGDDEHPPDRRPGVIAFISYSRQDYYLAEAVHAALSEVEGLRPWMDVAELSLGSDWARSIDDAVDIADVVVLVGSRAAANSAYVRHECDRAADRGVPVVMVVGSDPGRAVKTPVSSVHDLRSDFDAGMAEVSARILSGAVPGSEQRQATRPPTADEQKPSLRVARFYRPPAPVLALAITMLVETILVALALACTISSIASPIEPQIRIDSAVIGKGVYAFSGVAAFGPVVLCVLAGVATVHGFWAILHRRIKPPLFGIERLLVMLVVLFTIVLVVAMRNRQVLSQIELPAVVEFEITMKWTIVWVAIAVSVMSSAIVAFSTAVLHRTMPGYAVGLVRRRVTGERAPATGTEDLNVVAADQRQMDAVLKDAAAPLLLGDPARRSFRIVSDPQDRGIAEFIRDGCVAAGLREAADGYWTVVVVTGQSDPDHIVEYATTYRESLIYALASPIALPDDSAALRERQWLDFRAHDLSSLVALLREMTGRGNEVRRLPVPLSPGTFRVPSSVLGAANGPLLGFGLSLAVLFGFLSATEIGIADWFVCLLAALSAALCACLAVRVANRTYTRPQYRRDTTLLLVVLIAGVVVAALRFSPSWIVFGVYALLTALLIVAVLTGRTALTMSWLLDAPASRSRWSIRPLADFLPAVGVMSGVVLALIMSATVAPKPDLYWSNGVQLGALHPNTALPGALRLDNQNYLSSLVWSEPSQERVEASGLLNRNGCMPNCAEGSYSVAPVQVVASQPQVCVVSVFPEYSDGFFEEQIKIFTRISILDEADRPTEYDVGEVTTAAIDATLRCPLSTPGD